MTLQSLAHPSPLAIGLVIASLLFLLSVSRHMKGDFGPDTWALSPERPKFLRWTVHILVWPLRLLASLFASGVVLLFIALLIGFAYTMWRIWHG